MVAHQLSAVRAASAIRGGELTAEGLAESCLDRVRNRESQVRAWAHLDPEQVLAAARKRDGEEPRSAIHGLLVGVKDVLDTCDMPTEYGSPIYQGNRPRGDASCVALIRAAGGVVMGKTVTTEFATRHPGPTRNPANLDHTPGGSSSGSAAAVADLMVPLALGTQTTGSVIRPASYCGTVGYKPSFGMINRSGLKYLAESLDTIGIYGRRVMDVAALFSVLSGTPAAEFQGISELKPRIGLCHTPQWPYVEAPMADAIHGAADRLAGAGAQVRKIELPAEFDAMAAAQDSINDFESWRALAYERISFPVLLSPALTAKLNKAGNCTREQYEAALRTAKEGRARLNEVFAECDVLLAPSAPGEAPAGLPTGNPIFNQIWTLLHTPCLSIPIGLGPRGLPLGGQIIGPSGADRKTLVVAEWAHRVLAGVD